MADINKSFPYLALNEGGFVDDPDDTGGMTCFGITHADLARWRGKSVTEADMRALTLDEAKRIYFYWWWVPLCLDRVENQNVATCIFDIAVSRGIAASVKYLQNALKGRGSSVKVDGIIGPQTLFSINHDAANAIIWEMSTLVRDDYVLIANSRPRYQKFLKGWTARADRLLTLIDGPDAA